MLREPIFLGDHPALDWLNSGLTPRGESIEFLGDGNAYLDWLVGAGLLDASEASEARARFEGDALDQVAAQARVLREWFRAILHTWHGRGTAVLSAGELRHLNDLLAADCRYLEGVASVECLQLRQRRRLERPTQLLCPLAQAVLDLATGCRRDLIRRCANPQCCLWFLDRSKAHARLFCSPAVCGNRAKVAAYRARRRLQGDGNV